MAKPEEYAAVAAKLQAELQSDVTRFVPPIFQGRIPPDAIPHLSKACAKVAVDALDAFRATEPKT